MSEAATSHFRDALEQGAATHDLDLASGQLVLLERHYKSMLRWNKVHNLTRVVRPQEAAERHYLDSALGFKLLADAGFAIETAVDVGSGAGFPGLVGAVLWPHCHWTLLDSSAKRCSFLRLISAELGLNLTVLEGKAGEVEDRWPLVVSRATFSEAHRGLALRVASPGGTVALWIGQAASLGDGDLHDAKVLQGSVTTKHDEANPSAMNPHVRYHGPRLALFEQAP